VAATGGTVGAAGAVVGAEEATVDAACALGFVGTTVGAAGEHAINKLRITDTVVMTRQTLVRNFSSS
jgi:hypothetical protein